MTEITGYYEIYKVIKEAEKITGSEWDEEQKEIMRTMIENMEKDMRDTLVLGDGTKVIIEMWYRVDRETGGDECGPLYTVSNE